MALEGRFLGTWWKAGLRPTARTPTAISEVALSQGLAEPASASSSGRRAALTVSLLVSARRGGVIRRRGGSVVAMATVTAANRPLPHVPEPEPLRATDGKKDGAAPEDVFTWDTVTSRMPKIMDSVIESLPASLAEEAGLLEAVKELQAEMREGAQLKLLEPTAPWVNAEDWNEHLKDFISRGEGWHSAPWWLVENYMYKRLLQELARCGETGAAYDPFEPSKNKAMDAAVEPMATSLGPLLELVQKASSAGAAERRAALEATLVRSLWGNQADLSLSAGKVESYSDSGSLLSDQREVALNLLEASPGKPVIIVLDNHGLEVLCDLVLVDAILQLTKSNVVLHVKDAPVFVSDVTNDDVPGILGWLEAHSSSLAARLKQSLADGRLSVLPHSFYTSARAFWEVPEDLASAYAEAASVILKGDANYRRLLGDLHWPYSTDFSSYVGSFWPGSGLVCLRTMKSGVALGVSEEMQMEAKKARPKDWLTSGIYGQILAFWRT